MTDTRNRLDNPSPLAKAMEAAFGEPWYMSATEMEAALIAQEMVLRNEKEESDEQTR